MPVPQYKECNGMPVDVRVVMQEGPYPPWIEANGYMPTDCNILDFEFLLHSKGVIQEDTERCVPIMKGIAWAIGTIVSANSSFPDL